MMRLFPVVEFVVYTALTDNRRTGGSGMMKEYTTTYAGFQEHPCRVCDRCKESYKQRSKFIWIVPVVLLGGGMIIQYISRIMQGEVDLEFKLICGLGLALIMIEVAAFFLNEYLFAPKNKARNKAKKLREAGGGWITGLTAAEYKDLKSK